MCVLVLSSIFDQRDVRGSEEISWVNKTLSGLSVREKIAQLMMVEVRPSKGQKHLDYVDTLVTKYGVGGIIHFKTDPQNLFLSTQKYQSHSKVPLLVGIDGEWGVSMRLDNTIMYPYQIGLGGIQDEDLIYKMGRDIGKQCKRLGIHINFAPVIDVNNNPENPVINFRSFGEDPDNVARKGWLYAKGLQDEGVIACAKHFPGHGDTKTDSHKDLPLILHDRDRLDSIELKPFRYLIDKGVMSIMTAHVYMPAIDTTLNLAISLSKAAIHDLLIKELGFKGLAITDALDMQGVAKFFSPGNLELKALLAGNDILLCPTNVPQAIDTIENAIREGVLSIKVLDEKVRKVLQAKAFVGLKEPEDLYYSGLLSDLNNADATKLYLDLVKNEICLARNEEQLIPLLNKKPVKVAAVALGSEITGFETEIQKLTDAKLFSVNKTFNDKYCTNIVNELKEYDLVVVGLHNISKYPKGNYGITEDECKLVERLKSKTKLIVVCFGNPYSMRNFPGLNTTVFAFGDDNAYYNAASKVVWGSQGANARLSVTVSEEYKLNAGMDLSKGDRLVVDEDLKQYEKKLSKIDRIVKSAIDAGATPGCQVLIAQNGKIVFDKAYGKFTYSKKSPSVKTDDLYDLASITKVAATTLAIMKLTEEGKIGLDDTLANYLPKLKQSDKKFITIRQILVHESGLKAFIPFYSRFYHDKSLKEEVISGTITESFCYEINEGVYVHKDYVDQILKEIADSPLGKVGEYVYSDLGMIMLRIMIEKVTGEEFEKYLDRNFYVPMGLKNMTFNPRLKFEKDRIAPTEKNPDFRTGTLQGFVHDPSAALLGGVSGHAGLFSNAFDLAEIAQMLLNNGFYKGQWFLKPGTIQNFTKRQSPESRRGLGFDKPENTPGKGTPASKFASDLCFGHTGFTGTCFWADPENGIVYVFLSNRIHPSSNNKKLITQNVRTDIMDVAYETLVQKP